MDGYPAGLHARPASAWADAAKAGAAPLRVRHGADMADPRSLVSLLQLGLKAGDRVTISASGPEARQTLDAFLRTVTGAPLHFTQAPCTIVLDGEGVPRYA